MAITVLRFTSSAIACWTATSLAGSSELVKRKTVMAIAHRLQSVRDADNIVVLDSGRVESQGTHDELLARSPLYAALWAEQQRANGWKIKPEASPRP